MIKCITCCKVFLILGIIIGFMSVVSYFGVNSFLKAQIHKRLILKENSTFQNWLNPPAFIYRKYYLFNITNPNEVEQGVEKANLVQMGPYVYREILQKRNVSFTNDDKVTYSPVSVLYFEPSLSNGTMDDLVTFINVPAVALIEKISKSGSAFFMAGMLPLFSVTLFVKRTVNELLTGYDDPLLNLGKFANPKQVKTSKFSLMNDRNNTISHNVTIYIGSDNMANIGRVHAVNGLTKLSIWSSDNANKIKGSDGIIYPPFIKRDKPLYSFSSEMCRSLKLEYLQDNMIDGVETYDFHLAKEAFYNSTLNPENEGYCSGYDCLGNGVFNLSRCLGGISMFGSSPHFLNAEEKFVQAVNGLNPNEQEHDYRLSMHPLTGAPVRAKARFQLSLYIPRNTLFDIVKRVKPFLLPLFWIEVDADVSLEAKVQLSRLTKIMNTVPILHLISFLFGLVLVILTAIIINFISYKSKKFSEGKKYSAVKTRITN